MLQKVKIYKNTNRKSTAYNKYFAKAVYDNHFVETDQTRHEQLVGAHAVGYNQHSIGVCYEGGLDEHGNATDTRTPEQKAALLRLLRRLKKAHPDAIIKGHRELPGVHKECPCFDCSEYKEL